MLDAAFSGMSIDTTEGIVDRLGPIATLKPAHPVSVVFAEPQQEKR